MMTSHGACGRCGVELRPKKNGVTVAEMSTRGALALWMADLWACPVCKTEIIQGFGYHPLVYASDTGGQAEIVRVVQRLKENRGWLIPVWLSPGEREQTPPECYIKELRGEEWSGT